MISKFITSISNMFRKFSAGRYGIDNLTIALLLISAIFLNRKYLWLIGLCLSGYAIFRAVSKDKQKRLKELQQFNLLYEKAGKFLQLLLLAAVKGVQSLFKNSNALVTRLRQRKDYVFIKCPKCRNTLRLPRNKGKLIITCPVCKLEFVKKV
jgi:ribosomal protein S27E